MRSHSALWRFSWFCQIVRIAFVTGGVMLAGAAEAVDVKTVHSGGGDLAIVFVHGLAGDAESSFTNPENGVRWFDLIRAEDEIDFDGRKGRDVAIYSIDYSDAFRSDTSIFEIANQVIKRRDFEEIFRRHNHVWFIAHSMGGLVLRQALVTLNARGMDRFLDRVVGAAFLGVPSNGAALADAADKFGSFGKLAVYLFGARWEQIKDLRTADDGNRYLQQLQSQWAELVNLMGKSETGRPFHVPCAYETRAELEDSGFFLTRWLFRWFIDDDLTKVVSLLYTSSACSGDYFPINEIHTRLPKPTDAEADAHNWMIVELREALKQLKASRRRYRAPGHQLSDIVRHVDLARNKPDRFTNLLDTYAEVTMSSPRVRSLRLNQRLYSAPTFVELFRKIARDHECLKVEFDLPRRRATLSLDGEFQCEAPGAVACAPEDCLLR